MVLQEIKIKKMGLGKGGYILHKHLDLQVVNKMQHSEVFFHKTYQE